MFGSLAHLKDLGGMRMSEENIKRFFETIARIISEREKVRITVQISKKEGAA